MSRSLNLKGISVIALAAFMVLSWTVLAGAAVTIVWAVGGSPKTIEMQEQFIKDFEKENPGIKVEMEKITADWRNKITTRQAAGTAPDVFPGPGGYGGIQKMNEGLYLALDDYFSEALLSDIHPLAFGEMYGRDGHLYTVVSTIGIWPLMYNKDMFDEAGVAYPDESWDWDTIVEAGRKIVKDEGGKRVKFGSVVIGSNILCGLASFVWQNGGEIVPDGKVPASKIALDGEEAMGALQFAKDLIWKYNVAPTKAQMGKIAEWQMFVDGHAAMFTDNCMGWFADIIKHNWDIAQVPKGPTGIRAYGTYATNGWAVNAWTKHPDEAVKLLLNQVSPNVVLMRAWDQVALPSRLSTIDQFLTGFPFQQFDLEAIKKDMPYMKAERGMWGKYTSGVEKLLRPVLTKAIQDNEVSLEEAIPEVVEKINAYLESAIK